MRLVALGVAVLLALLTTGPSGRTCTRATRSATARPRCARSRRASTSWRRGLAPDQRARRSSAAARRLGLVKPGEHLFIVQGISEWRRAHCASNASVPLSCGGRPRRRRKPARPRAARLPARRRPLPVRPAGRDRAGAVRPRGRPVPDDLLPHLPHLVARGLATRGCGRRGALVAGRRGRSGSWRPASARANDDQRSVRRARRGPDRSDGGRVARARRRRRRAPREPQVPACSRARTRSPSPGYLLGERILGGDRVAVAAGSLCTA